MLRLSLLFASCTCVSHPSNSNTYSPWLRQFFPATAVFSSHSTLPSSHPMHCGDPVLSILHPTLLPPPEAGQSQPHGAPRQALSLNNSVLFPIPPALVSSAASCCHFLCDTFQSALYPFSYAINNFISSTEFFILYALCSNN